MSQLQAFGWMEGPGPNPKALTGTRLPLSAVNPSQSCRHQSTPSPLRMLTIRFKRGCSRVISTWTNSFPQPYNTHNQSPTYFLTQLSIESFFIPFIFTFLWVTTLASFPEAKQRTKRPAGEQTKKSTMEYDSDTKSEA